MVAGERLDARNSPPEEQQRLEGRVEWSQSCSLKEISLQRTQSQREVGVATTSTCHEPLWMTDRREENPTLMCEQT